METAAEREEWAKRPGWHGGSASRPRLLALGQYPLGPVPSRQRGESPPWRHASRGAL